MHTLDDQEARIRQELGIPLSAQRVLILSQSAHLDWDWLNWFSTNTNAVYPPDHDNYFHDDTQPADTIFQQAYNLLTTYDTYYYSICEISFLQAFANDYPSSFAAMKRSGRLRIVGGGITSPDNLLPHGECFIRTYLVGKTWMGQNGVPWTGQVWLPDDFGHDSQLPVMLQAMGVAGVGFARIPGSCQQGYNADPPQMQSAAAILLGTDGGVDFIWQAADTSRVFAHWLEDHYNQGIDIDSSGDCVYNSPADLAVCQQNGYASTPSEHIAAYISTNGLVSPTPYLYVEVSDDFILPKKALLQYAEDWNNKSGSDVYVVVATFDHYVRLVRAYAAAHPGSLKTRAFHPTDAAGNPLQQIYPFRSTPYWMGFYASRPALKALHHQATRALLGAEAFQAITAVLQQAGQVSSQVPAASLFDGWAELVPSTHHDYITGTAIDYVYDGEYKGRRGEQLVRLERALDIGHTARQQAMATIAANIDTAHPAAVVFNQLGFDVAGLVDLDASDVTVALPGDGARIQRSSTGTYLIYADVPSLGYKLCDLSSGADLPSDTLHYTIEPNGDIVIENDHLAATISKSGNWSLSSVVDKQGSKAEMLGDFANTLVFYQDAGDVYRFGYESTNAGFSFIKVTVRAGDAQVVETGPLRLHVTASITVEAQKPSFQETYTLDYYLVVGEPFVRMTVTGAAPTGTSVMVRFPLKEEIDAIEQGTPYHWDHKVPYPFGTNSDFNTTFEATHDFVIATARGTPRAAIYHGDVPAWTVDRQALVGCILRNTFTVTWVEGSEYSDPSSHAIDYALRVPSGMQSPATGTPLKEARMYNTPLRGLLVGPSSGRFPQRFSLASAASPKQGAGQPAILTAAKVGTANPSDLILRVYQPTNGPLRDLILTVNGGDTPPRIAGVSALEVSLDAEAQAELDIRATTRGCSFTAPRALTTLAVQNVFKLAQP